MKILTETYFTVDNRLPKIGQHIIAHQTEEQLVVYQAYHQQIADYAVKDQMLGGSHYSYNRMSWIKPNFLWMMYRCGWASKKNQERVLAIWIKKSDFETILKEAVFSSYQSTYYNDEQHWKEALDKKDVRLQWDPDHDPFGNKLIRRAIQLGMKGEMLQAFGKQFITFIEDITEFVKSQKVHVDNHQLDKLLIPAETTYQPKDETLYERLGID